MNAFVEFVDRYGPPAGEEGPLLFCREVFGVEPDPWQERVLRAYGRGERRISVRSCHRVGKTTVVSWISWHQLLTKFPQKTVATAPTSAQLYDALYSELLAWGNRLPPTLKDLFTFKSDRIELKAAPQESFFSARTSRAETPEALQGIHSQHVLLLVDEASGVPEPVFEAAIGSMAGHNATTILTSNPVRTSGTFFDSHHTLSDMWFTVHVSHEMSPRVSTDFVEDVARRYGRDSNAFRVRCLGEFPRGDLDTLIPYELIVTAQNRDIDQPPGLSEVWGLDVARSGDDWNVLVRRNRLAVLPLIEAWQGKDLMETTGKVVAAWKATPHDKRPTEILVDVIGLGAGVVDRLRELGLPVRGINVGEVAAMSERFRNLRTELWSMIKDWLETRDRSLPSRCTCPLCTQEKKVNHAEWLASELASAKAKFTSNGKLMLEPKDEMKKRIKKSPNVADAFALTFAGEPATLLRGSGDSWSAGGNWNEPLSRGLAIV